MIHIGIKMVYITAGLLMLQTHLVMSKKLLMISLGVTSHCLEMSAIGAELVARGHNVSMFFPEVFNSDNCLGKTSNIRVIPFYLAEEQSKQVENLKPELAKIMFDKEYNFISFLSLVRTVQKLTCETTLSAVHKMKDELQKEAFDAIIVDAIPLSVCFFAIPKFLSVPAIAQSSAISQHLGNIPFQTSTYPNFLSTLTTPMSFTGRLRNFVFSASLTFALKYLMNCFGHLLGTDYTYIDCYQLYQESILFIENSDFVLDFPKATFPNFIQTGPLTAKHAQALSPDLETFVSKAEEGVIYISFGSVINQFPDHIMLELEEGFSKLKQRVVFKGSKEEERKNVKTVKWISQNDILGHQKTILFISHCGKNSFFESLYHGVPIICSPLNSDAFSTASKVEHFNVGAQFDIRSASAEEILTIIYKVINNPKIRENMKRASTIIKDRPFTPAQTAVNAIEHVLKYGSNHMTSPLKELSFFSYAGGDVWLFIFIITFFICWLFTKIFLKCVFRK